MTYICYMGEGIRGCAFLCNDTGIITRVLRDDFGLTDDSSGGTLFPALVLPSSRNRSLDLMLEARSNNVAFDYRLDMHIDQENRSVYFMAVSTGKELLIIGADNHTEAIRFTNHLQEINNEQSNYIRQLLKNQYRIDNKEEDKTAALFEELTRANNELLNLKRELSKKNIELEKLNQLKNRFLGMAAHDLRNPLSIVLSYAEFLADEAGGRLTDEQQKFLQIISGTTEFMLSLVEDMLDYSRIESGELRLDRHPFDFVAFCRSVVETMTPLAEKKSIELVFDTREKEIIIDADRNKCEQVLHNLIMNSIKFSDAGSRVEANVTEKKDELIFFVRDQGRGISREEQKKLFIPFTRISGSGTAGEKGTGLGLTIVKRIVEGHKGRIRVESEPGRGSTFIVSLPLKS